MLHHKATLESAEELCQEDSVSHTCAICQSDVTHNHISINDHTKQEHQIMPLDYFQRHVFIQIHQAPPKVIPVLGAKKQHQVWQRTQFYSVYIIAHFYNDPQ